MTRPHHYVQCDVPEGMTLRDYRAAKRAPAREKRGLVARLRARRARRTAAPARATAEPSGAPITGSVTDEGRVASVKIVSVCGFGLTSISGTSEPLRSTRIR